MCHSHQIHLAFLHIFKNCHQNMVAWLHNKIQNSDWTHKKSHIFIVSKERQIKWLINLQYLTKCSVRTEVITPVIGTIVKERQIYRYKNKSRDIYNFWRLVRTTECTWDLYAIGNFSNDFMILINLKHRSQGDPGLCFHPLFLICRKPNRLTAGLCLFRRNIT